jgi:hypothetical protein
MHLRFVALAIVVGVLAGILAGGAAFAAPPAFAQSAGTVVDLALSVGRHDDAITGPRTRARAAGGALSNLGLAFRHFGDGASFGWGGSVALERFAVAGAAQPASARESVTLTGFAGHAGLALRAGAGLFTFLADAGYGGWQMPVVHVMRAETGVARLGSAALAGHGPTFHATVALAAGQRLGFELGGELAPIGFGGSFEGADLRTRRYGLAARVILGQVAAGPADLGAIVEAAYRSARGSGDGAEIEQSRSLVALGLRASFRAPPAAAPRTEPPGRLRIVVLAKQADAAAPAPLAHAEIAIAGRRAGRASTAGELVVDGRGLGSDPVALLVTAPGFIAGREFVTLPRTGDARVEVVLEREAAPKQAALTGFVRAESGAVIPARVELAELGLATQVDGNGAFAFDVAPGTYTLVITAPGHIPQRKTVDAGGGEQRIFNIDLQPEAK